MYILNKLINLKIKLVSNFDSFHKPYSILNIITDGAYWVLNQEAKSLYKIAAHLGIKRRIALKYNPESKQCVHYTEQFAILNPEIFATKHRFSLDYFHGDPISDRTFFEVFNAVLKNNGKIHRIRVSHRQMENLVLSSGILPEKVCRIPIGIDIGLFVPQTKESKKAIRKKLGVPENAVVIGSFQKDGNGWSEGLEPKLIKGPDIFLKTVAILNKKIKNLHILLTGPARGYVRKGLEKNNIPYTYAFLKNNSQLNTYFHALDVYIITSREEGGPKAVLESMASGIPLVSTMVGQAADLIIHGKNGWVVPVEDVDGLVYWSDYVLSHQTTVQNILNNARKTAEDNSLLSQLPLWNNFFQNYIER